MFTAGNTGMSYSEPLWEINGNQAPVSEKENSIYPECEVFFILVYCLKVIGRRLSPLNIGESFIHLFIYSFAVGLDPCTYI